MTNISQRLTALSRAQDALFDSTDDRVSVRSLVDSHLAHLNRVNATGDAATVLGRSAIYLALALHELGTNALKYGASGARVEVTVGAEGPQDARTAAEAAAKTAHAGKVENYKLCMTMDKVAQELDIPRDEVSAVMVSHWTMQGAG